MPDTGKKLERARSVQAAMLPDPPQVAGLEIASGYRACEHVGGDFYDFVVVDSWRMGFVMADVSGHGTAAALVMAAAKKALQLFGRGCPSPREALVAANDSLLQEMPRGMFISVLYAVLDLKTRRLDFARAGHNPLYLLRDGAVQRYSPDGLVLGVLPRAQFAAALREESVELKPGDVFLLYTDGLTEAMNAQRAMWGDEAMRAALAAGAGKPAIGVLDGLLVEVDVFRGNARQNDDEAVVAVRLTDQQPVALNDMTGAEGNLPPGAARLIGRDEELTELASLLTEPTRRLVTVTGAAGVGKTRLALAAASVAGAGLRGGAWFVDLSSASDATSVVRCVATALGIENPGADGARRVSNVLAGRASTRGGGLLLVLDNCEQCLPAVTTLLPQWLNDAPQTRALCTSRASLGVKQEYVFGLRPLRLPRAQRAGHETDARALAELATVPAVALFMTRARERDDRFTLDAENAGDVAELVRRLDGIPLALELAAARVRTLSPRGMLERIGERLSLLGDRRGTDLRTATLRGAIDWSWSLLNEDEKSVLAQLSAFPSGFMLEVAEQAIDAPDVLDAIESLRDKSLLDSFEPPGLKHERRFMMLESVRAFATERLVESGRLDATRAAVARAMLAYVRRWWEKRNGPAAEESRRRTLPELDFLQEIARGNSDDARWAAVFAGPALFRMGGTTRAGAMIEHALEGCPPGELRDRLLVCKAMCLVHADPAGAEAIGQQVPDNSPARAEALFAIGQTMQNRGNGPALKALFEQMLKRPDINEVMRARVSLGLGNAHLLMGEPDAAEGYVMACLEAARKFGDKLLEGQATGNLGVLFNVRGKREEAARHFESALRVLDEQQHYHTESIWLLNLGVVLNDEKQFEQAEAALRKSLRLAREHGVREAEAGSLSMLATVCEEQKQYARAVDFTQQALVVDKEVGNPRGQSHRISQLARLKEMAGLPDDYLGMREHALELARQCGDGTALAAQTVELGGFLARQWLKTGDQAQFERAESLLTDSYALSEKSGAANRAWPALDFARALKKAGRTDDARSWAKRALAQTYTRDDVRAQAEAFLRELG